MPKNRDEIMDVIDIAVEKIKSAHEEGEKADHPDTICKMLSEVRFAAIKLLDPRHKDDWIEGADGSRELRPQLWACRNFGIHVAPSPSAAGCNSLPKAESAYHL